MSERPILFNGAMVRAVLSGAKTQTRRLLKPQPKWDWEGSGCWYPAIGKVKALHYAHEAHFRKGAAVDWCPYGAPGDTLRVRETWTTERRFDGVKPSRLPKTARIHYMADGPKPAWAGRGRPSIFLPKWGSRLTMEVTGVRVERLNDISEADALAEGIARVHGDLFGVEGAVEFCHHYPQDAYADLWRSINGDDSWKSNPWVWVVSFRVRP